MIKVLIVEDHPIVIDGLLNSLKSCKDIVVTAVASTGEDCFINIKTEIPDILLLDLKLPDATGFEIASAILEKYPNVRIIVFTSHSQTFYIKQMLNLGVSAYVLKSCDFEQIKQAIYSVFSGETFICAEVEQILKTDETTNLNISKRELEVLQCISVGMTNVEIAEKLFISPLTVDSHRKNLIIKFEAKNTASMIQYAHEKGYLQ